MKTQKGFSLIEIMVAVAIVGILTAIAVPAYSNYVIRGKIPEATSTLASLRVMMEQYYQDNRTYLNAAGTACGVAMPITAPTAGFSAKYFTFTCVATATTYILTATGNVAGDTSMNGFNYSVENAPTDNLKESWILSPAPAAWQSATAAAPSACWIMNMGGQC